MSERTGERWCTATSKSTGERCRHYAMHGQLVCRHHGGSSPQAKAKARERLALAAAESDARRLLAYESTGRLDDPLLVLEQVTAEAVALKAALAARVNALTEIRYTAPGAGTEQLRAEVALLERAMDRVARFADLMLRHNLAERRVELAEAQGRLLAGVVREVLVALGLSPEQEALVPTVVPAAFRRVARLETVRGELA